MILHIVGTSGVLYHGEVHKVSVPTSQGIIWILPNHINLATILTTWNIVYSPVYQDKDALDSFADHTQSLTIIWWMTVVEDNVVTVVVE
jgi:F0F1-type ATP synthase epsilon subunit